MYLHFTLKHILHKTYITYKISKYSKRQGNIAKKCIATTYHTNIRSQGHETFSVLNLTKHEIYPAYKC